MVGKTKAATKAEKARFEELRDLGCIACLQSWVYTPMFPPEIHHLLSGGRRRGHAFTIPLCKFHHQGIPIAGWTTKTMREVFGPSLRLESRAFHEQYGSDDQLLAKVNALIEERA